ncbi:LysR family substrate-binding domain-containing protein [Nocardioides sp. CER19]|uniref:LysR family substrate-binding domain-containing protein n=1 Tax=Nocardioides sp. CER19 TaxID=3038538 RepID=UPI00244CA954|nr:LysR family substrate-binding domain-containing protein [Nocardioides sp. CER19]MDH2415704.1 LysR family substrate-binding domain-containing protein [Nocardioides sp. CER19]
MTFRLGFVTGATPDKWARTWRERSKERLEVVPLTEAEQEPALRGGEVDMAIVRLPVDRDGLHLIKLYEEVPVVVLGREHYLSLADEVTLDELAEEQLVLPHRSGWTPRVEQLAWPPMSEKDAVETVAAGTGIAIVPMSVARLFHRKDVVHLPVRDVEPTTVGLAWAVDRDDERTQTFVGIVRGRTANSSRR